MALIISDKKAVFIRIPRTGSTAMLTRFCGGHGGHVPANTVRNLIGSEDWPNWFSFAVVRNPWDRMVSIWYALTCQFKTVPADTTFEDFVMNRMWRWAWRGSLIEQHRYVTDDNGKTIVTYIGRYEQFDESMRCIHVQLHMPYRRLGDSQTVRPRNEGYRHYYNDRTREIIAANFATDIQMFGYKYEANGKDDGL